MKFPMDQAAYQRAKIQSFFDAGLAFFVIGERSLKVDGFNNVSPDAMPQIKEGIRRNKDGIINEVLWMENRLKELIQMADHSRGMTPEQLEAISAEGDRIIDQLPAETVDEIFKNK